MVLHFKQILIILLSIFTINLSEASSSVDEVTSIENSYFEGRSIDEIYHAGRQLYATYNDRESLRYLLYSAQNGNGNAAYYYAIALKNTKHLKHDAEEIKKYMLIAAKQEVKEAVRYFALRMNELPSREAKEWREKYFQNITELNESQPAQAELEFYLYYYDSNKKLSNMHLNKAIELKNPIALMLRADRIKNGKRFFLFRQKKFMSLYRAAAKSNFIPAIRRYISILNRYNLKEESFDWSLKAAALGDLTSIAVVARMYGGFSKAYTSKNIDLVSAKLYYDIYLENAGRDQFNKLYEELAEEQSKIKANMSKEDLKKAALGKSDLLLSIQGNFTGDTSWTDNLYFYSYLLNDQSEFHVTQ